MSRLRLSVATKIAICFAVVLVTFASVGMTSILSLYRLGRDLGVVGESYLPLTKALAQLETLHKNKERDTDHVLHERDRSTERVLVGNTRNYFGRMMQDRVRAARETLVGAQKGAHRQDQSLFVDLDRRLAALADRYGEYTAAAGALYDALSAKSPDEVDIAARTAELRRLETQAGREVSYLSAALETQIASRVDQVHRVEVRSAWVIIALSIGSIALGLLATFFSQRLLLPIRILTEEVRGISRGDFARRVELHSSDEVGALAEEFNAMAASLRERERQLLEQRERLVRSERLAAIGQVSAQITHEIRNPLSSIGLNAELLADELAEAQFPREAQREEAESLLSAIARQIDRLTEISEQYLAFGRAPRGPRVDVDLNELCEDLSDFLRPELRKASVDLRLVLDRNVSRVNGNEDQLRQALLNLLRNGREAMSASGGGVLTLETSCARGADGIVLEVTDTGPGVPDELRDRLFEPFFSTKTTGTGLGLALSQRIAAEHGGTLQCEPRRVDQGARFVLTLPPAPLSPPPDGSTPAYDHRDEQHLS